MNEIANAQTRCLTSVVVLLLAGTIAYAQTQNLSAKSPIESGQTQNQTQPNQPNQGPALIQQLNLTPEQIRRWRMINVELKDEQQAANQRLRQARRALADAVESPSSNEELIKQRAHDVSEAQAAIIQLQALRESRILQMLTPEQRVKLKEFRQQQQEMRRAANQQNPRNAIGKTGLPRNPNGPPPGQKQRKILQPQTTKPKR